jgi:hypothetical protein
MRLLPLVTALICSACAYAPPGAEIDPSTHVERVLEDVSAMIEGMTAAHAERRVVLREPGFRSSAPTPRN